MPGRPRGHEQTSAYEELGVTPVINACGIYTDLGGSCLSATVLEAVAEANESWASMPELLDRSGEAIAALLGVEAARVVPGASAGLALSVGACMTGHDGALMEQLPDTTGLRAGILMQRGHRYKYTRCALMTGARVHEVGGPLATSEAELAAGLRSDVACVLHPAHLDGHDGTVPLDHVTERAHAAGIPVVVDAAYMSFPTELIASYTRAGADLACFSAKYFWGPNAGGFVCGRADLIDAVAQIDFTRFESGQHLIFGRAFKMDRSAVIATTVALREWLAMDHDARWAAYARRGAAIVNEVSGRIPATVETGCFTLDERLVPEPVNSVFVRPDGGCGHSAASLAAALAQGRPSVQAVAVGEVLSLCLETVREDQDELLAERLLAIFDREH